MLGKRLLNVIGSVVSPNQTWGIPGRFTSENIALIITLLYKKGDELELEPFLQCVLRAMLFGPSCGWVKLLYTNVQSMVQIDGFLSGFFTVGLYIALRTCCWNISVYYSTRPHHRWSSSSGWKRRTSCITICQWYYSLCRQIILFSAFFIYS